METIGLALVREGLRFAHRDPPRRERSEFYQNPIGATSSVVTVFGRGRQDDGPTGQFVAEVIERETRR